VTGPQPRAATQKPPRVFRDEPEWSSDFRQRWTAMLWQAMARTGEGYHRPEGGRSRAHPVVERSGRRGDKVGAAAKGISNKLRARLQSLGGR